MHRAPTHALFALATVFASHVAIGQGSTSGDSARAVANSASPASATPAVLPASPARVPPPIEIRDYQLTDSVSLGDLSAGTQYTYIHQKHDQISVFVSPYPTTGRLDTQDDTVNFVVGDITQYYQTLDVAARRGQLDAFRPLHHEEDDVRVHGTTIRAADMWAQMRRRGAAVWVFTYYAIYALPTQVVRIRADLPWSTARNEEVGSFAKSLVAAMVAAQH